MMISPESYIESQKDKSYTALLRERDYLIRSIRSFEKNNDNDFENLNISPSPETVYYMELQYLSLLCNLIAEVYQSRPNDEFKKETDKKVVNTNVLLQNIDKMHSTETGIKRIKDNLGLTVDDVIEWCKEKTQQSNALITRKGKNWYVLVEGCKITVNASSYTIITAHKIN